MKNGNFVSEVTDCDLVDNDLVSCYLSLISLVSFSYILFLSREHETQE